MYPIRKNFYNSDILMLRYEKLFSLFKRAKEPLLKKQIEYLIELCEETKFRQDEFPYDLSAWPYPSFGLSISDKKNSPIVELAQIENLEDSIVLGENELMNACGYAFINGDLVVANDLKKIKELNSYSPISLKIKDYLQVVEETSLSYLLSFKETECSIDKDKKIIFFDGNKFILVYTDDTLNSEEWDLKRGRFLKYKKYKSLLGVLNER